MKKLNKPPVSKEQQALEDYVVSLLSESSNVLPISDARRKKEKVSLVKPIDEPVEVTEQNITNTQIADKGRKQREIHEPFETPDQEDSPLPQTNDDKAIKASENKQEKAAEIDDNQAEVAQEAVTSASVSSPANLPSDNELEVQPREFEAESEAEELERWNALLKREAKRDEKPEQQHSASNSLWIKTNAEKVTPTSETSDTDRKEHPQSGAKDFKSKRFEANDSESNHSELNDSELNHSELNHSESTNSESTNIESPPATRADGTRDLQPAPLTEKFTAEETFIDPRLAGVQKLLARMSTARLTRTQTQTSAEISTTEQTDSQQVTESSTAMSEEAVEASFVVRDTQKSRDILPEVFQTLIFNVGRLPLAVPLLKLGGIIKFTPDEVTPLVGTPAWFMGLLPTDRGNLMVVDSQLFLMPDQAAVAPSADTYEYIIQLDDSNWAMACNSVGDAKNLTLEDVRWSARNSQRPWFAGMVVDYMSALIEVDELINMLAQHISE